jgi:hypothetical protein
MDKPESRYTFVKERVAPHGEAFSHCTHQWLNHPASMTTVNLNLNIYHCPNGSSSSLKDVLQIPHTWLEHNSWHHGTEPFTGGGGLSTPEVHLPRHATDKVSLYMSPQDSWLLQTQQMSNMGLSYHKLTQECWDKVPILPSLSK